MAKKFCSRKEAKALLDVSIKTVDRLIRRGSIKAFKPIGSTRVLIDPDSLTQDNLQSPKPPFKNDL